ncbi:hypothetical protein SDC9_186586 [bioreactor metagenome]|uniref:Uncharacterized protein n=1 Tax=bioreactor metagenome TaxID=1076179 RepID=A0A645HJY5_9ZZZZ
MPRVGRGVAVSCNKAVGVRAERVRVGINVGVASAAQEVRNRLKISKCNHLLRILCFTTGKCVFIVSGSVKAEI